MKKEACPTADLILEAATRVFIRKGFAGARMEEIARESGMNRALLHYYFQSKERLFNIIFERHFKLIQTGLGEIFISDDSVEGKIRRIILHYYQQISQNPFLPMFVMHELSVNPDRIVNMMRNASGLPENHAHVFIQQVNEAGKSGLIRPVDGAHLLSSIFSMIIYPFLAKPVLKMILQTDEDGYQRFINNRPEFVTDLVLQSIKP